MDPTYYIRANLFLSSRKAKIWTPKMTNEAAKAVTNATKLIPCEPCAVPSTSVLVAELVELVLVTVAVVADM